MFKKSENKQKNSFFSFGNITRQDNCIHIHIKYNYMYNN